MLCIFHIISCITWKLFFFLDSLFWILEISWNSFLRFEWVQNIRKAYVDRMFLSPKPNLRTWNPLHGWCKKPSGKVKILCVLMWVACGWVVCYVDYYFMWCFVLSIFGWAWANSMSTKMDGLGVSTAFAFVQTC
jgi:hypothetical protein